MPAKPCVSARHHVFYIKCVLRRGAGSQCLLSCNYFHMLAADGQRCVAIVLEAALGKRSYTPILQAEGLGSFSPGQAGTPAPPWVNGTIEETQPEGLRLERQMPQ